MKKDRKRMLNKIREEIKHLNDSKISFNQYYHKYMFELQDELIYRELRYMMHNNITDRLYIDRELVSAVKETTHDTFDTDSILLQ